MGIKSFDLAAVLNFTNVIAPIRIPDYICEIGDFVGVFVVMLKNIN